MVRIPRTEASVPVQMANQPTMSPDALTGPGRALQGLGRAISGLAGAFEASSEPSEAEVYDAKLAALDATTKSQIAFQDYWANMPGDADPMEYASGFTPINDDIWRQSGANITNDKLRRNYDFRWQSQGSQYSVHGNAKANGVIVDRRVLGVEERIRGGLSQIGAANPDELDKALDGFNVMIDQLPGASDAQKEQLRGVARKHAVDVLTNAIKDGSVEDQATIADRARELIKKWSQPQETQQPPPGQPQQGQGVGPQSSIKPIMDDSQRAKLEGVDERVVDKLSLLQGEMGRRFKINSGYRSKAHNKRVGGASKSQHIHGNAIDLDVSSLSNEERTAMIAKASALGFTGIGVYNNAIHLDIGGRRAWGSDYTHKTVPSWARSAIETHMRGGFAGTQVAESGGGAIQNTGVFSGKPKATVEAVHQVANRIGADPTAIGAVFTVESGRDWNPNMRTGSYRGVSQVGPQTLREMGVSLAQYESMSQAEQAAFYGRWLEHYKFSDKMKAAGIDFQSLPPARQAAILQAFQFAPNGNWVNRLGGGDTRTPVTNTKQARVLGSTSIADMERYFARSGVSVAASSAPNAAPAPGRPEPVQVADASGRIGAPSGGQIAERVASRVDGQGERTNNTIPGQQTAQAQTGTTPLVPAQTVRRSIKTDVAAELMDRLPELEATQGKARQLLQDRAVVEGQLKGEIPFNAYDKDDTKRLNEQYDMSKITERIVAGDVAAMAFAVNNAKTLGYVPPKFRDTLLAMTRDMDPEKVGMRIAGYEMASDIALAFPNAFAGENGGALKSEALDYASMVGTGMGQKEALAWIDEMRSPAWKKKESENAKFADAALKKLDENSSTTDRDGVESWVADALADELDQDMTTDPFILSVTIPAIHGEFKAAFRRHFIRMPNADAAKERAMSEIKGAYGISRIGEKSTWTPFGNRQGQRLMKYPVEKHYPPIGGKETADGSVPSYEYIERDVVQSVRSWLNDREQSALDRGVESVAEVGAPDEDKQGDSEITMDNIYLVGDDVTRRQIEKRNPNEPPSYMIVYRDPKTELLQVIPPEQLRWSMPPQLIKALQAKHAVDFSQRGEAQVKKEMPALDAPAPAEDTKALDLINKIPSGPKLDGSVTGEIGKRLAPLFETNQKPKQPKREMSR